MKNTYNFNVEIETPEKTNQEQILFLKWKPILRGIAITKEVIEEYKNDLLSLKLNPVKTAIFLLFTSFCFSQTAFISAGKENFTIGETFPIMQQCDTVINEVSLSVPKYTIETPKPIVIKKLTFWQKLLKLFGL